MKVAWCLGGGGSRGIIQWGMIKRFWEAGLYPDVIMGTSIGSLNGAGVVLGDLERIEHLWLTITNKQVYRFAPWQLFMPGKGALYDFSPMLKTLEDFADPALLIKSKIKFYATVTSLRNNTAMRYRLSGTGCHPRPLEILQASCSPPLLTPPVRGEFYDGGVSDNYNVGAAIKERAKHIIMMHPSRPVISRINNAVDAIDAMISISMWSIYQRELQGLRELPDDVRPTFTAVEPAAVPNFGMWNFDFKGFDRRKLIKLGYELAAKAIG